MTILSSQEIPISVSQNEASFDTISTFERFCLTKTPFFRIIRIEKLTVPFSRFEGGSFMNIVMRQIPLVTFALFFSLTLLLMGCSSSPSDDEMRQLNDLKAEVVSLEQQVASKEKEKADLEKQVAEKNGRLQQCMADKDAVKGSMK